jgi:hypothetical protein
LGLTSWQVNGAHAVSPTIDSALTDSWPRSSCGYDEWYFFHEVPDHLELHALCNWGGSVGDAGEQTAGLPQP